jgi:hypothetical protein
MNIGAVEQCADRRNEHNVIGPNQFPQLKGFLVRHTMMSTAF